MSHSKSKIDVGIVGAAGFTGGELLRLLLNHPHVDSIRALSASQAGKPIASVHRDLFFQTNLRFESRFDEVPDVVFLCGGHGNSQNLIDLHPDIEKGRIIDLSQDFRLRGAHDFVYGLIELNGIQLVGAHHVANPGCYATTIQLGLLPFAKAGQLPAAIHTTAITGSTGAGQKASATTHFSWRGQNASVYKVLEHQHLAEIRQSITQLQPGFSGQHFFVPMRGAFTRGILACSYFDFEGSLDQAKATVDAFYRDALFVRRLDDELDLKMVVQTNHVLLQLQKKGSQLVVVSVADNLLKGASGQAVQNMNVMFEFEETAGLNLKPGGF